MTKQKQSYKNQMILVAFFALASLLIVFVSHQLLNHRLVKSIELARELDTYSSRAQQLKDNISNVDRQLQQTETAELRDQNLIVIETLLKEQSQLMEQLSLYPNDKVQDLRDQHKDLVAILNQSGLQKATPLQITQKRQMYLQLEQELSETLHYIQIKLRQELEAAYRKIKKEQKKPFIFGLLLFVFLAIVLIGFFWFLLKRLSVFLQNMTTVAQHAQDGQLSHRLEISAPDELGQVEREFNSMLSAIENFKHKLEASNKDLEEFAQMASHDLQAPLRYISAYTHMLTSSGSHFSENEKSKFAENIQKSTHRLTDLIRNLLEFSKIGSDQARFDAVSVDSILSQIVDEAKIRSSQLSIQIQNGSVTVIANRALMQTLFQNLIDNSIKYNNKNNVHIIIDCIRGGENFEFHYNDNGPGIPEKDHERVFDLFQRRQETENISGYGVGLAVCRKIMRLHSGKIEILPSTEGLSLRLCANK